MTGGRYVLGRVPHSHRHIQTRNSEHATSCRFVWQAKRGARTSYPTISGPTLLWIPFCISVSDWSDSNTVAPKRSRYAKSLAGRVSWRCGNPGESKQARSLTGVISSSWVLVRGRRKEFCRVAAVAPNLDHIASMKPGGPVNVLWCEIGIVGVARTKTRWDRWIGKEKQKR